MKKLIGSIILLFIFPTVLIMNGCASAPALEPTSTPFPPTSTPEPTKTPTVTFTYTPTETEISTSTFTPTATPIIGSTDQFDGNQPDQNLWQSGSIADNFLEYDSTELINEEKDLSDRIPIFSVKYPPEWEYGWFGDSGVIGLMISSVDPKDAFAGRDESGAVMMIVPVLYSGEELTDLFFTILNGWHRYSGLESYTTTINGQDAAWAEYTDEDSLYIEVVIVQAEWALPIVAHFPVEKETEFRPLIETTISTIEIK